MFTQKADIDALRSCLEPKGAREAALARAWEFYSDALEGCGENDAMRENGAAENCLVEMAPPQPDAVSLPPSSDTWEDGVKEGLRDAQFERFLKVPDLLLLLLQHACMYASRRTFTCVGQSCCAFLYVFPRIYAQAI